MSKRFTSWRKLEVPFLALGNALVHFDQHGSSRHFRRSGRRLLCCGSVRSNGERNQDYDARKVGDEQPIPNSTKEHCRVSSRRSDALAVTAIRLSIAAPLHSLQ